MKKCPFACMLHLLFFASIATGLSPPGSNTPPVIVLQRNWKIPENEIVGSRIERVRARDAEHDPLVYGIKPGLFLDGSRFFRIDEGSGDVYLNQSLKGQAGAQFYLFVTASDGNYESKTEVFVEVTPPDGRTQAPQLPPSFTTPLPVTVPPSLLPPFRDPFRPHPGNDSPYFHGTKIHIPGTGSNPRKPIFNGVYPDAGRNEQPVYDVQGGNFNHRGAGVHNDSFGDGSVQTFPAVDNDGRSRDLGLNLTATIIPILAIIGFAPLVGLAVWLLKRKCHPKHQQGEGDEKKNGGSTSSTLDINEHSLRQLSSTASDQFSWVSHDGGKWEFCRNHLKMLNVLGEGCFGQVWKSEAWCIAGLDGVTIVAVKTLKDNAGERETKDLLSELEVMKSLDPHPNVVHLLGACTDRDPIYVIMEYVPNGKLLTYLRNSRAEHYYKNLHGSSKSLTSRDLTSFCYQIAKGMEYLSSKGIVHRDLAARNILIGENKVCKVADFGFARDIVSSHIYERKSEGRLPIRWMAPESLFDNIFSVKTDIWSFGILMWEIVTLGSTPYPGMAASEVMQKVKEGHRLEKPEHCKREIYNIMYYCWDKDASSRPSFTELHKTLEQLLVSDVDYIELDHFPDHMYYNLTLNLENDYKKSIDFTLNCL